MARPGGLVWGRGRAGIYGGKKRHAQQPKPPEGGHRHQSHRRSRGLPVLRDHVRGRGARPQRRGNLRSARHSGNRCGCTCLIPFDAMDIVVTVKQVPDPDIPPTHFRVDEAAKTVIPPAGVSPVMNGYDAHALEAALRLREQLGGKVTVVSLGPDSARDALKRAIAMGADAAVHVNDPSLNGADSTRTARALAAAIKKLDHVDLVLCGRQASDTDGGQVHLGIAAQLGLPAVSPIQKIDEAPAASLVAERIVEDGSPG